MVKKKFLIKVRTSRKRFIPLYIMSLIIILLLIYFPLVQGAKLLPFIWKLSIPFIVISIIYPEYYRIKDWWAVTETSLIQSQGLFDKNVREIDFSSVSDLDLEQILIKRLFNYGNVNVRLFLNETTITIKDINNPDDFIEDLQEIMSKRKGSKNALRKT